MKTKICFQLFLSILFLGNLAAQYPVSDIPESLKKNAHTVIRAYDSHFKVSDKKFSEHRVKVVYTVLNSVGKNVEYVHYDGSSKVTDFRGTLYNAEGKKVRSLDKRDARDYSGTDGANLFTDNRVRVMGIDGGKPPYTVAFEYTVKSTDHRFYPGWHILPGYGFSLMGGSHTIVASDGLDFSYRAYNADIEPTIEEKGRAVIYRWAAEAVPALEREPYADRKSRFPVVNVSPHHFVVEEKVGSFRDWKSFGQFIHQLNEGRNNLPETTRESVRKLIAGASDDEEKVRLLYRYLQDNMRYVSVQIGIGGWKSFDAQYVDQNKFGDCKALSFYMHSMLDVVGIESYPVLVYAGEEPPAMEEDFAHGGFNHMILYVPETDTWLECTSNKNPAGYLGSNTEDRNVLLVTPEGGQVARTPLLELDREHLTGTIALAEDGAATLDMTLETTGEAHEMYRHYADNVDRDFREYFQSELSLPSSAKLTDLEIAADETGPNASVAYSFEVMKYGSRAGTRMFVPVNTLSRMDFVPPKNEGRLSTVVRRHNYEKTDEVTLQLPEGYRVENLPEPVALESVFGTYSAELEERDGEIVYRRALRMVPTERPAAEYEDLRDFFRAITKADKRKLVLIDKT